MKFHHLSLLLALVFLLTACSFSLAEDVTPPPDYRPAPTETPSVPRTAPDPANGALIYTEKCAPCHGVSGLGDGPSAAQLVAQGVSVAALGDPNLAHSASPEQWYRIVTLGKMNRFMPGFNSLSASERWDVVAYALSLSAPADQVQRGGELFQENCARCHGAAGQGDGPDAAGLSDKPANFTSQAFMVNQSAVTFFNTVTLGKPPMPAFGDQLNADDRWALAAYVRSLSFAGQAPAPQAAQPQAPQATAAATPETASTPIGTTSPVSVTLPVSVTVPFSGTVLGQIVLLDGAAMPTGVSVILYGFEHTESDMQLTFTSTAQTQADGSFRFDRVPMSSGGVYGAAAEVGGASFTTNLILADAGQVTYTLPLTVSATTTDASLLVAERMHLIVSFVEAGTAQVQEIYVISNPTNWPVVPSQKGGPVVAFDLPQGISNLQIDGGSLGDRFIATEKGFADTQVVYPGAQQYQVAFSYDAPFKDTLDLSRRINLNTSAAVVLLSNVGLKVTSDQLSDQGTFEAQSSQYRAYSGNGLAAGTILTLAISEDKTASGLLSGNARTSLIIGLVALGIVLIGAGLWTYRRSRLQAAVEPAAAPDVTPPADDADALMDAINALDDLYRDGKLPEEAYRQRRAELKDRLKQALQSK